MLDAFAAVWRLHFMQKWRMENSIALNMIKWICLTYESASKKIYCTRLVTLLLLYSIQKIYCDMRCIPSKMRYNQFWNYHSVICRLKLQRCTKRSSRIVAQVQDNCQNSVQQGRLGVRYYQTQTACTPLLFPERLCRD